MMRFCMGGFAVAGALLFGGCGRSGVLKIVDEQVAGDKATVTLTATLQQGGKEVPANGTVVMVREGGAWKVDQETWARK